MARKKSTGAGLFAPLTMNQNRNLRDKLDSAAVRAGRHGEFDMSEEFDGMWHDARKSYVKQWNAQNPGNPLPEDD